MSEETGLPRWSECPLTVCQHYMKCCNADGCKSLLLQSSLCASSSPREHELKCWPKFYEFIADGSKTFEIRENDRGFQVGDILYLREWNPVMEAYTGRDCRREVSYTTDYAQGKGYIVMGLQTPKSCARS